MGQWGNEAMGQWLQWGNDGMGQWVVISPFPHCTHCHIAAIAPFTHCPIHPLPHCLINNQNRRKSLQTPMAHMRTYRSVKPTQIRLVHAQFMCQRFRQLTQR